MKRTFLWLVLLMATAGRGEAADLTVNGGSVQATWRDLQKVSVAPDAVLRAGHEVTVTVTGQVDINQEQRSERRCSLFGLRCGYHNWTEHHFVAPNDVPVVFQVRKVGTLNPLAQTAVGATPATLKVPLGGNIDFTAEYELVATLNGVGSTIDPARSAGAYQVKIEVDAGTRAGAFAGWINASGTQLDTALGDAALDQALKTGHGAKVATALRNFAKTNYPVTGSTNRAPHERLLRKAVELAPDDPANPIALADMFRALGLYTLANEQVKTALASLESKTDPRSRRLLGDAYRGYAKTALAQTGGLDSGTTQEASVLLTKAFNAYRESLRRDLMALALTDRAQVLRSIRSRESLTSAAKLLENALELTPLLVPGRGVAAGVDGANPLTLDWKTSYRALPIDGSSADAPGIEGEMMVAWDAAKGRMLSKSGKALVWRSPDRPETAEPAAPLDQGVNFQAANGAILAQPTFGEVIFSTPDGVLTPLQFGAAATCTAIPAPNEGGPTPIPSSLGPDGDVVATACADTMRIYQRDGTTLKPTHQRKVPSPARLANTVLVAGPAACGVFVGTLPQQPPPPAPLVGGDATLSLVKLDGTTVSIKFASAAAAAPGNPPPPPEHWPVWVDFTSDGHVLVARPGRPVTAFRCSDGAVAANIPLPSGVPTVGFGQISIRRMDANLFAIVEGITKVSLLDWSTKTVRGYGKKHEPFSFRFENALLPPAVAGGAPRYIKYDRTLTIRKGLSEDAEAGAKFPLESGFAPVRPLSGGNFLLSEEGADPPRLLDLRTGKPLDVPDAPRRVAVPLSTVDGWAAPRFAASDMGGSLIEHRRVEAVEVLTGAGAVSVALPAVSQEVQSHVEASLKKFATDVLAKQPDLAKVPEEANPYFPAGQVWKLIGNLNRLRMHYLNMPRMLPLSKSLSTGAHAICGWPQAISESGVERPFTFMMVPPVAEATLITYSKDQPTFVRLPPLVNCFYLTLVQGTTPTALLIEPSPPMGPPQKFTLKVPRGDKWAAVQENPTPPIAGWAMADSSLLLLLPLGPLGPSPKNFALKRLGPTGGLVDACPACGDLKLGDALATIRKTNVEVPTSWDDIALLVSNFLAAFGVDATGQVLAYPDGEETVVRSLASNTELLRTNLAPLAHLTRDVAVFGPVDERLEIQPLKPQ